MKFGSPPTQADYQYSATIPSSANQQVLVPEAAAGTWYALVYSEYVPLPDNFTISAATLGHLS